jgi:6-phosphogluconate dehydrogenase
VSNEKSHIGLIGLGTMGAALALNIADNGYSIAVYNRTAERTRSFAESAGPLADRITATTKLAEFVEQLAHPRKIILMVPAGSVVDEHIAMLEPFLDEGDIIVDCGNANYQDTNRRAAASEGKPWRLLGVGVSGGEEGARHGPSIMAGGAREVWDELEDLLVAISAKHTDGTPCAAWLGEAGAGHFVKMVHNGIEYADMQMIAEIYGLLRDGHDWPADRIGKLFARWNEGNLQSYLVEITARVAQTDDTETGKPLLDVILDAAGQKGTGRWTVVESQHLATPVPVIEAAVGARNMSARRDLRKRGEDRFGRAAKTLPGAVDEAALEAALITGKILCYAQGFAMLARASENFGWAMPLATIARIWRQGCIIRSAMLDDMASAFERDQDNLVFDDHFAQLVADNRDASRATVVEAMKHGHPVPALSAGLAWFDQLCMARSTANLIQGQRDFFGLHGFKRLDRDGDFHGPWGT